MSDTPALRARAVWHAADVGVLSTISTAVEGYPLGSVTPYVTLADGRPVLLVSAIAQHTRNMQADPRVCLTVLEDAPGDKQAQARVSLLGDAAPATGDTLASARARYLTFFPESRRHFEAHDFAFWTIAPRRVRFIAGFGDIHWIETEDWAGPVPGWDEADVLAHMNADHTDALVAIVERAWGYRPAEVALIGVTPLGWHLRTERGVHHQRFHAPCPEADARRAEAVRLAREARGA